MLLDLNELPYNGEMVAFMGEDISDIVVQNGEMNAENYTRHTFTHVQLLDNEEETIPEQLNLEPFVGQTFQSEEEARVFYDNYARLHGFSIKRDRTKKKDGKMVRRDFYCHRSRTQPLKNLDPNKEQRNRVSTKCNCNAHLRVKLRRNNEIFPEEWHVTTFTQEHNHPLLSRSQVRFLPANRMISQEDEKRILLLKEAGLAVRQIIRVLELEKDVEHGELPFLEKDIRNLFTRVKKTVSGDDVANLLQYFKSCKEENSNFHYIVKVDHEGKLEHLLWCPAQSIDWYDKYGDVVVFDTTYKVNVYDMPCGIFVGVNNHGKTILYGCALLRNETIETFKWLMKNFVAIMRKPPKTIITDQDPWMTQAIAQELPYTKHCFCIWHITSKFSGWFTFILREKYQEWCKDFYMLYKLEAIEEFENQWPLVVGKYNLRDNKHVKGLYQIKEFWAPAYLRSYYFGGMRTTGRSEYINGFIKRFVTSNSTLKDLAKQIDVAIREIIQRQEHDNMLAITKMNVLKVNTPLEDQASQVLTPFAFEKFKEECCRASQYSIIYHDGYDFMVRYYANENSRCHKVFWDGNFAMCSCKQYEFSGIICRHILRIFVQMDCHEVPSMYLPIRWRVDSGSIPTQIPSEQITHCSELINGDDILCPPKSKPKGRPKNKRQQGGKELTKQTTRHCSKCKKAGHYANNCWLDKENASDSNGAPKKKSKPTTLGEDLNPIFLVKY
ncbi:protein FAR1-RELATED SEQUENCE 11-like isoform X2 [Beta vulgaris subsp. vulgaris]|nr:protein FAR1-RELATED SEQUENCE 11-like isoform X2 [Beta vulgaris subsp. vulgaris]